MPPSAATTPNPMAPRRVVRKPVNSCWEVATGITISALIRSKPTVRIERVMVTEATTTMSRFNILTRTP